MPVPGEGHEDVREHQHQYGPDSLHNSLIKSAAKLKKNYLCAPK
jgi:hypothetical protein